MKRFLQVLGVSVAVFGIGIGVLALLVWFQFVKPFYARQARIQKATSLMASYGQKEWKELYEGCLLLYDLKTESSVPSKMWPKRVVEINPHDLYLQDGVVHMDWTGGFDEFHLSLEVFRDRRKESYGIVGPGVRVIDTREIRRVGYGYRRWPYMPVASRP
jgi:hypothetical protein